MNYSIEMMLTVGIVAVTALAGFASYRWQQRNRVRAVKLWVEKYLFVREGMPPLRLKINCSDDQLWPVLVSYDDTRTGNKHSMRFHCQGSQTEYALLSETISKR